MLNAVGKSTWSICRRLEELERRLHVVANRNRPQPVSSMTSYCSGQPLYIVVCEEVGSVFAQNDSQCLEGGLH